jgi:hypothetical protein
MNGLKDQRTMGPNYFKNLKEPADLLLSLVHCQFMKELTVNELVVLWLVI